MTPQELKTTISKGLPSFPLTDFDANDDFRASTYAKRLEWLAPYGATALFAAGGTGEFFSLTRFGHSSCGSVDRNAKGRLSIDAQLSLLVRERGS